MKLSTLLRRVERVADGGPCPECGFHQGADVRLTVDPGSGRYEHLNPEDTKCRTCGHMWLFTLKIGEPLPESTIAAIRADRATRPLVLENWLWMPEDCRECPERSRCVNLRREISNAKGWSYQIEPSLDEARATK